MTGPQGMSGTPRLIEDHLGRASGGQSVAVRVRVPVRELRDGICAAPLTPRISPPLPSGSFPPRRQRASTLCTFPHYRESSATSPGATGACRTCSSGKGGRARYCGISCWRLPRATNLKNWQSLAGHVQDPLWYRTGQARFMRRPSPTSCANTVKAPARGPWTSLTRGAAPSRYSFLFAFLYRADRNRNPARRAGCAPARPSCRSRYTALVRKVARERGGQVIVATHSESGHRRNGTVAGAGILRGKRRRALGQPDPSADQLREALKRVTTTDLLLAREVGGLLYVKGETDEKNTGGVGAYSRSSGAALPGTAIRAPDWRQKPARSESALLFAMQAALPDVRALCLLDGDKPG